MKIISHRGMWSNKEDKNSIKALSLSLDHNFGIETDIRDFGNKLVISHDPPSLAAPQFGELLKYVERYSLPIAINIKADGLKNLLLNELQCYKISDHFVFDMSIPETRSYISAGIPFFVRMSEYELSPPWLEECNGVWLDAFLNNWFSPELILSLLSKVPRVCIVSSELHGRDHAGLWQMLRTFKEHPRLLLCTDMPKEAANYFGVGP